jgi:hypothetical protein
MAKSFKPSFAGAVGITLAASCFASDADAMTLRAVGGWARTPNVSVARPNIPYARAIIPYRAPIIPYRSPGATVTTGSMPMLQRYRQAQWQQQGQKVHQVALQQQAWQQKQAAAAWFAHAMAGRQTTQSLPPLAGVGAVANTVQGACAYSLENVQCNKAVAASNQAAAVAAGINPATGQPFYKPTPNGFNPTTGLPYSNQQQSWQQQQQKQQQLQDDLTAAQAAALRQQLNVATTKSQVDYIKTQATFVNDPSLNQDINLKQSQLSQPSIFNSSPGAIGK